MTAVGAGAVTMPGLLHSEWTKFRSLRSTWWSLLVGVALSVGVGLLGATDSAHNAAADVTTGHIAHSTQLGVVFAQLALLVLAALFITGEYSTGMIRSTMTVVPRRVPALAAKAGVLAGVLLPMTFAASGVAFLLGNAVWRADGVHRASLGEPAVLQPILGSALYLTLCAFFALAVGTLLRNTAASVTLLVGLFFVLPSVSGGVPGLRQVAPYLPSNAGGALSGQGFVNDPLPGWEGMAVFAACTLVVCLAAVARLRRSDV